MTALLILAISIITIQSLLLLYALYIIKEWYIILKAQSLYDYEQLKKTEPKEEPIETIPLYNE